MYIAVDIGGSNARITYSESLDLTSLIEPIKFPLIHDFEKDFSTVVNVIEKLVATPIAIGIGTPGIIDEKNGLILSAHNISEWETKPIVKMFEDKFKCKVFLDNDAKIAALGEATFGTGTDYDFLYITWGTGVGGAKVVRKGKLKDIEQLNWDDYLEKLEYLCGGGNIKKRFHKPASELTQDEWDEVMVDFKENFINISNRTAFKTILIGGGATAKHVAEFESMSKELKDNEINLLVSKLGDNVGLYGAFTLIDNNL